MNWIKSVIAAIAAASLATIGIATFSLTTRASASSDPFQGISAAEAASVSPPSGSALTTLQSMVSHASGSVGEQNISAARLLPASVQGSPAYVLPSSDGNFCFFAEALGVDACAQPLSSTVPALLVVADNHVLDGDGAVAFGVAKDGVQSITIAVAGVKHTVPVVQNVFEYYAGPSASVDDFTTEIANLVGGQSVTLK
jgi:hypothetical protein